MPHSLASDSLAVLCRGVDWQEAESLQEVAADVEVLYQTRIQKERFQDRPEDYEKARGKYIINADLMKVKYIKIAACFLSRSLVCVYLSCSIRLLNVDCTAFVVNGVLCGTHLLFESLHHIWQLCCPV